MIDGHLLQDVPSEYLQVSDLVSPIVIAAYLSHIRFQQLWSLSHPTRCKMCGPTRDGCVSLRRRA